jgi:hypothetical protein
MKKFKRKAVRSTTDFGIPFTHPFINHCSVVDYNVLTYGSTKLASSRRGGIGCEENHLIMVLVDINKLDHYKTLLDQGSPLKKA